MNKKNDIRRRIVAVLKEKISETGDRVFDSLDSPIWESGELPALNVLAGEEQAERFRQGPLRTYSRDLNVVVEAAVSGVDAQGEIDDLCSKVEDALNDDPILGGVCEDIDLSGSTSITVEQGSKRFATAEVRFVVRYLS